MSALKANSPESLDQWAYQAIGLDNARVKVRLRGNDLHILCEAADCPEQTTAVLRLIKALQATNLDALKPKDQPQVYQVFLSGKAASEKLPNWLQRLHLNQLDRHLEQLQESAKTRREDKFREKEAESSSIAEHPPTTTHNRSALIVSNKSLARQGNPDAIARYLSETLSRLGVGVRVTVKQQKSRKQQQEQAEQHRLWIFCESIYSPDPSLIAEPIAEQLRDLKLEGFQDAAIVSNVTGETAPDWTLRVDLTPPEVMLKEWGRWGDLQAIARLLNAKLAASKLQVSATLKDLTLHLFCTPVTGTAPVTPNKHLCMDAIAPLLDSLAPQGIHAATIYGQTTSDLRPDWVDWLNLPAKEHLALSESTLTLARQGDEPAITFLLSRLLNSNLDWRLATGGIRVVIRRKEDLLHIMTDAPVCPQKRRVGSQVAKFLRGLEISDIGGVRIYGRRAGNKQPFWQLGVDFKHRKRLVPEAAPEFAASHAYIGDLVPHSGEEVLRPDLTGAFVKGSVTSSLQNAGAAVRAMLLRSQLFLEGDQSPGHAADYEGVKIALVWGTLGLLLTLQADWLIGQILTRIAKPSAPTSIALTATRPKSQSARFPAAPKDQATLRKTVSQDPEAFNASGFTAQENTASNLDRDQDRPKRLVAEPLKETATARAIILAARSQTPTFNSRQLDEQLALYQQRVSESGPPDVLIIGSSRALRGVDPAALSKALAAQGYADIDVFNFGVNGATAQVVDLIVRQILTPEQLPKLILWADGARAFNSGRVDVTYNGITVSEGYKQLSSGARITSSDTADETTPSVTPESGKAIAGTSNESKIASGYQTVNDWLNRTLAGVSATYPKRDQLKSAVLQQIKSLSGDRPAEPLKNTLTIQNQEEKVSLNAVDLDGFLPLSIRFNPTTYYQKHSRVSGDYDSDYESFQLQGDQDKAMQALLEFSQTREISIVFVNTPLTQDYLDPIRSLHEEAFEQYMLRLANRRGFTYRNLTQLYPTQYDYFSDPSHLNRYGAYEVANYLAKDALISWTTK